MRNKAALHKISMDVYERHGYQISNELLQQAIPHLDKHEDEFQDVLESIYETLLKEMTND